MAKQKNRLTATRPQNRFARTCEYWPGERPAYPVPTLHPQQSISDETGNSPTLYLTQTTHLDPNRFLADTEAAYPAPLVSRLDDLRPASQGNRHPDRPSLSCLPYSYPAPPSFRPTRQPTSDSTKTNQPTLDPIPHTQSTLSPRIDPRIDKDRVAYPAPSNTQPHTIVPDWKESNSTKSNSTTLHRPSGDDISKKAHNPYKSPEIRRTHWGNRGEGRLTLSRS